MYVLMDGLFLYIHTERGKCSASSLILGVSAFPWGISELLTAAPCFTKHTQLTL